MRRAPYLLVSRDNIGELRLVKVVMASTMGKAMELGKKVREECHVHRTHERWFVFAGCEIEPEAAE